AAAVQNDRMFFAAPELVRRIERAECSLLTDVAEGVLAEAGPDAGAAGPFVAPIGGGVATFVRPGSPLNKLAGVGFEGPLDGALLEAIEAEFLRRGAPLQAEVSALADPAALQALGRRGYALAGFENVLGLRLTGAAPAASPDGVVSVSVAGPGEERAWREALVDGFDQPDGSRPERETFSREALAVVFDDVARARGQRRYLARVGGVVVGGASLRLFEGVAQLSGAATLPAFRRRGVQTALLAARLADAARAGCDLAVVTTEPGTKSQENVMRQGFSLLYAREALTREPRG
ncbi:MAG TPA: GNAT family N-acetyltransferase, partial [Polyangiaceae bacterium]|nr:GNAT family N-acetyltransferase [Polyangiaceae bacterium]